MLFWLFSTVFFGLLTVHPYTTYPIFLAILARLRGHKPVRFNSSPRPVSYDVVFCAHNEAESIASKIENCQSLAARYDNVRIHVFNDGSSDADCGKLPRGMPIAYASLIAKNEWGRALA